MNNRIGDRWFTPAPIGHGARMFFTVAIATARPHEMALAMVKSTLGPGAKMMSVAAIKYSQSRDGRITVTGLGLLERRLPKGQVEVDSLVSIR